MLSAFDPIGKIQEIYREGDRKVPYALFMNVFNALLEDQMEIIPREPTEGLTERFRAACMAAHAGVSDPEGRGPERVREFLENVYPVWRRRLSEEEFAKFDEIVGGQMRERFGDRGREGPAPAEARGEPGGTTGASSALLERLQIGPGTEEGEEPEPAVEVEPPRPAGVEQSAEESAIDALLDRKIAERAGQEEEEPEEVPTLRAAEPEPPEEAGRTGARRGRGGDPRTGTRRADERAGRALHRGVAGRTAGDRRTTRRGAAHAACG